MKYKTKKQGIAIIELLIYSAILAVMSILVVNTIILMTRSFGRFNVSRNINNSVEVAMERMTREIRLADSVDFISSDFDIHPGRLTLNTVDSLNQPTTVEFFASTTVLMLREGILDPQPLTSSAVDMTNLIFREDTSSSTSKAIKIEISLQADNGKYQKTDNFYNTVILRRSY